MYITSAYSYRVETPPARVFKFGVYVVAAVRFRGLVRVRFVRSRVVVVNSIH